MLKEGSKAPEISLEDQNGNVKRLSDFAGQKVVLYFYPKDMTGGCTKQAVGFAELCAEFADRNTRIIGVSKDSVASHKKFEEKYALPFTLLSDPDKTAITAYGVWQEKKNYGKVTMGVVRSAFLIDEQGVILKALYNVKAADNPQKMLDLVRDA